MLCQLSYTHRARRPAPAPPRLLVPHAVVNGANRHDRRREVRAIGGRPRGRPGRETGSRADLGSAPEGTRTPDPRLRRPLLYPPELLAPGSAALGCRSIGARGFEPPTPCTQGRCATRLRHAPRSGRRRHVRAASRALRFARRPVNANRRHPGRSCDQRCEGASSPSATRRARIAAARCESRLFASGSTSPRVRPPSAGTAKIGS